MFAASRSKGRAGTLLLATAIVALVPLSACNDDDDDDDDPGDMQAPTAQASPATSTFTTGTIQVSLSAMDNADSSPDIYYTTDATIPTTASTAYAGPITVDRTLVLRYIAVDNAGNISDVGLDGYTQALNPIAMDWAESGHGDIVSEAFRHWDEDGDVSTSCGRCHAGDAFADFMEDGVTDLAAALPIGHDCDSCHTAAPFTLYDDLATYPELEPLLFPSGAHDSMWNQSNMCAACHLGRSSTTQVDEAIDANPAGPYSFINIHYFAAAASYFGAETSGGYQYESEEYVGRNPFSSHPPDKVDCVGCHMRGDEGDHHFVPEVDDCTGCHGGTSFETLGGSPIANHDAIEALKDDLLAEIQIYANDVIGTPIVYDTSGYPYFFVDLDGDGVADPDEADYGNRYTQFDENLLKASYNYQVAQKDPAGFIHNGIYLRQLLYDSIVDLGGASFEIPPGRPGFNREDATKTEQWHLTGHADSLGEPFRHWDEEGEIPTSCGKCHSPDGFIDFCADGVVDEEYLPGGLVGCAACHAYYDLFDDVSTRWDDSFANPALEPITFPSSAMETLDGPSNICAACHQGRASGVSIDDAIADNPTGPYSFINRHYFAAAAILFGSDVTAGYEYLGQSYLGQNEYAVEHNQLVTCVGCHMRGEGDHGFLPEIEDCDACHWDLADFEELGLPFGSPNVDYDGDGTGESFQHEIDGVLNNLYQGIQDYALNTLAPPSPIIYVPGAYPYWFKDTDGNGMLTEGEDGYGNRYQDFDADLLRAAYNYHSGQDPCGDMHNYQYVIQTLYDSFDQLDNGDFDGSVPGTRP